MALVVFFQLEIRPEGASTILRVFVFFGAGLKRCLGDDSNATGIGNIRVLP
jgi:hypothetical protein